MSETILSVDDLKTYFFTPIGTVKAVDGAFLDLQKGEILGVAGESGCGKSTLALSIMQLIRPPGRIIEGSIKFKDYDLITMDKNKLQKIRWNKISITFQQSMYALNPLMRIKDQMTEALTYKKMATEVQAEEKAKELLELLEIPPSRIENYPHEFSGGMKQRVLIAMSLMCDPEVMILDEPTTALDVVVQNQLLRLISRLQKAFGLSVIWITHNLPVLAEICDKLVIMYAGKTVESGRVTSVINNPKHPYTMGLLESFPKIDEMDLEIKSIRGSPPDLIDPPSGCRFHPRCPYQEEICRKIQPQREKMEDGGFIECHLWKQI